MFLNSKDIINRAATHLGVERIRSLTEHSVMAVEGVEAYDKLRLAELRRATWTFATRRVILRAVDEDTSLYTPAAYASGTTYSHGHIVSYGNEWWQSQVGSNTGNTPEPGAYWQHYYGPDMAAPFDTTAVYYTGDIVVGTGGSNVYLSLNNDDDKVDPDDTITGWLQLGGSVATLTVLYPYSAGPLSSSLTNNVMRLPRGFLRRAPADPKAGTWPNLGGPVNAAADGWMVEGRYIITPEVGPVVMRYVADMTDVTQMDPMFCEMLAARIAMEVGPRVIQDKASLSSLVSSARDHYRRERFEAIGVNALEIGPVEAWEDDYIIVRQ